MNGSGPREKRRVVWVFLNVPYDDAFEDMFLAYVVGLSLLSIRIRVTLAVPSEGRLNTIIDLIDRSDFSIHDLSRVELSGGLPRFNMPLELGLALYRSRHTRGKHTVHIFDRKPYQVQRSTSDVNGIDPLIHHGQPKKLMIALRDRFRPKGDVTTVPEMLASYRVVKKKLPEIRKNAGGGSLFRAAIFEDIVVASLIEAEARRAKRPR